MKITKKMKEDFEATRDLWKWLSETGEDTKNNWSHISRLFGLLNGCAFCEYYMDERSNISEKGCVKCPLYRTTPEQDVGACLYPVYRRWAGAMTKRNRKKYAKIMFAEIDKWCKENLYGI